MPQTRVLSGLALQQGEPGAPRPSLGNDSDPPSGRRDGPDRAAEVASAHRMSTGGSHRSGCTRQACDACFDPAKTRCLALRAAAFACGAAAIGLVVVPTERLLVEGVAPSQVVVGRLFWGAASLLTICILFSRGQLLRSPREHGRLAGVGLLLGWATVELYTRALAVADVLPVIVLLVASSAATGMLVQLGSSIRPGHVFVLLSVVTAVGATVHAASPGLDLQTAAVVFAIGAGVLYGALPLLCRASGAAPDLGSVAIYLAYGTVWAVGFTITLGGMPVHGTLEAVATAESLVAGVFCTGLGYALFQVGISPDRNGVRLGSSWATLLYGFEPVAAIVAAGAVLGQVAPSSALVFAAAFVALVALAGPTLRRLGAAG